MLIKICGIKTPEIALAAAQAGADFIGVVFAEQSKRKISIDKARQIVDAIKNTDSKVVAVFAEQTAAEIKRTCEQTGIAIAQLHGDLARAALISLIIPAQAGIQENSLQIIFAARVDEQGEANASDLAMLENLPTQNNYLLFDAQHPGSGKPFNWRHFHYLGNLKWFLSGGLHPDNVAHAVQLLHPYGVDVSSGVEKHGEKDINLIQKFIQECRLGLNGRF